MGCRCPYCGWVKGRGDYACIQQALSWWDLLLANRTPQNVMCWVKVKAEASPFAAAQLDAEATSGGSLRWGGLEFASFKGILVNTRVASSSILNLPIPWRHWEDFRGDVIICIHSEGTCESHVAQSRCALLQWGCTCLRHGVCPGMEAMWFGEKKSWRNGTASKGACC